MTAWGSGGNRAGGVLTLAGTLEAAEAAAPVESLDVVARMLKERLGATSVLRAVSRPVSRPGVSRCGAPCTTR